MGSGTILGKTTFSLSAARLQVIARLLYLHNTVFTTCLEPVLYKQEFLLGIYTV